ncbi:MAG: hypothetical protein H6728_01040 [Myxococcales bacterium]|nr:hypothetical protein [Myxococcales bacterium]
MAISKTTTPSLPASMLQPPVPQEPPTPPTSTAPRAETTPSANNAPPTKQATSPTPAAIDQFDATPGTSFTNQLLGLDRNADGQISRQEFAAGQEALQRLSQDGREADRAEQSVLRTMMSAYRNIPSTQSADASALQSPSNDIVLSYTLQDGQLVANTQQSAQTNAPVFSAQHIATAQAGLPTMLLETPEARVTHGDDPGDFYCEHMFFSAQMAASAPESSVLTNQQGEKMVGFLHVPSDTWMRQSEPMGYTQAERHAGTRQVIGAALRGYASEIEAQHTEGPMRMMITGYDQFMYVRNNPTGDFVSHPENLDASMQIAFGDRLLTPQGEPLPREEATGDAHAYRYQIRTEDGGTRDVILSTVRFPVDDTAINPQDPRSVHHHVERETPQAVISMGVAGAGAYRAEHRADNGGLIRTEDGAQHHDDASPDTLRLRDNYSLARAIQS